MGTLDDLYSFLGLNNKKCFQYYEGQTLYYEETRPLGIYIIKSGRVKNSRQVTSGRENLIGISNAGAVLGVDELVGKKLFRSNCIALEKTEVLYIPEKAFLKIWNDEKIGFSGLLTALRKNIFTV